jgi:ABC-type multidrug transport system fused ATPase/permease subunit
LIRNKSLGKGIKKKNNQKNKQKNSQTLTHISPMIFMPILNFLKRIFCTSFCAFLSIALLFGSVGLNGNLIVNAQDSASVVKVEDSLVGALGAKYLKLQDCALYMPGFNPVALAGERVFTDVFNKEIGPCVSQDPTTQKQIINYGCKVLPYNDTGENLSTRLAGLGQLAVNCERAVGTLDSSGKAGKSAIEAGECVEFRERVSGDVGGTLGGFLFGAGRNIKLLSSANKEKCKTLFTNLCGVMWDSGNFSSGQADLFCKEQLGITTKPSTVNITAGGGVVTDNCEVPTDEDIKTVTESAKSKKDKLCKIGTRVYLCDKIDADKKGANCVAVNAAAKVENTVTTTNPSAGNGAVGAVFGMIYKIVLMIVLVLLIVTEMIEMAILLIMTTLTGTLLNLSPNAPFLTTVAVPLSIIFANLANLVMGFLFILTGSQAMMGLIKTKEATDRCIQLSIYVVVSNFVYQMLAFVISFVDGFAQLVIKVFAGGDVYKLFYGLFSQFASISELRKDGSLIPDLGKTGQAVLNGFSQPEGVFTALVMKEAIIVIMFLVMMWIFKDTFVLVLTRSTILLLFLITSPILVLAYLVKDLLPGSVKNKVADLPDQIFTAISFNLTFVIAIVLCFTITQKAQESFKEVLKGTIAPATATTPTATAPASTFLDALGNVTGYAQQSDSFSRTAGSLANVIAGLAPVFMGLCILYFVNDFYKQNYFKAVQNAMSTVNKGISGGLQDFVQTKSLREGASKMFKSATNTVLNVGTGQRQGEVNLFKDGASAGLKSASITGKALYSVPDIPTKFFDGASKVSMGTKSLVNRAALLRPVNAQRKSELETDVESITANKERLAKESKTSKQQAVAYAQTQGYADKDGNVAEDMMPSDVRAKYDEFNNKSDNLDAQVTAAEAELRTAKDNLNRFTENLGGTIGQMVNGVTNLTQKASQLSDKTVGRAGRVIMTPAKMVGEAFDRPDKIIDNMTQNIKGGDKRSREDYLKEQLQLLEEQKAYHGSGEKDSSKLEALKIEQQIRGIQAELKNIK